MEQIPLSGCDITQVEIDAVVEVLRSGQLALGPQILAFEKAFRDRCGCKHAVAVNSGTSGLHMAVRALEIGPGDEVITTPFSFIASANCILFEGATPVFVDIDLETYNMDVSGIEAAITEKTKAIVAVHIFGRPLNMPAVMEIARRHDLAVIEDSCEALGARIDGRDVGTFGDVGMFAFYPNKQITTGEGGMVITDDDRLADVFRSLRNQGRSANAAWLEHERVGYNYRMSELQAAVGVVQMSRLDEILAARSAVADLYAQRLADERRIVPPAPPVGERNSWFVYVIRLAERYNRADRDALIAHLREQGVGCRNYFAPIHLQPFYVEQFGFKPGDFPNTEHAGDRCIAIPFFNKLTADQADRVCAALKTGLDVVGK